MNNLTSAKRERERACGSFLKHDHQVLAHLLVLALNPSTYMVMFLMLLTTTTI
jgi:hypothetical protein